MRLLSLELSGFRGFPRHHRFDLDADAVVVIGANGHGKTSLFDGILWALCGRIPRPHIDDARLVSMYSDSGQARVMLRMKDAGTGRLLTVTRSFDGKERRVSVETSEGVYQGPSAEGRLIDIVWPDAASASDPSEALASVLTRSVYLQQDLIRHFVEAASDQERFAAVSELVGAGRVTELQSALEQAKKAWSTATTQRQEELRPLRERLDLIQSRLSDLTVRASATASAITPDAWSQWWRDLAAVGLPLNQVEPSSRDAPSAIDSAIKQLDALRRSTERRVNALRLVDTDIAALVSQPGPEIQALRDKVVAVQQQVEDLKLVVAQEQTRLAEVRRVQAALEENNEQLKTLAVLALKHLEDRCPVCAQTYDKKATRQRLEAMAKGGVGTASTPDKLPTLLTALAAKEQEAAAAAVTLRSAEQALSERHMVLESLRARLIELGLTASGTSRDRPAVAKAIAEADAAIQRLGELQRTGESLALRLAQSSAAAAIDELRVEGEALLRDTSERERAIAARNQTGELAQRVIEALREAGSAVVQQRLREIGPLLQSIYARIDPHPAFRLVAFLSRVFRGRGELSTVVSDPVEDKECDLPAAVLSSSQVNALAVSVFLALNIGVSKPPLSVAILDDPLQSLDDINLLGLVDLLRRAKDRRQMLVSTHDEAFGSLLCRKLRPSGANGRTVVIELDTWSRQGPVVQTREVKSDPVQLRLVAARAG